MGNEKSVAKIIGKLLYIKNAIDFVVRDFDNIDTFIESQKMHESFIKDGESEGHNMDDIKKMHSTGNERYALRKEFKGNWLEYSEVNLDFDILDKYLKEDFINRRK